MAVLILAKHDNASLIDATAKAVTAAKAMGGDITVLVAGENCRRRRRGRRASSTASTKVIHVEGAAYGHRLAEPLTDLVRVDGRTLRAHRLPGDHLAARTSRRASRRSST